MASHVIPAKPNLPQLAAANPPLRRLLASRIRYMGEITYTTNKAVSEIGDITAYASFETVHALSTISILEQGARASGVLSEAEQEAIAGYREELCEKITKATEKAAEKIVGLVEGLPDEPPKSLFDEVVDFFCDRGK